MFPTFRSVENRLSIVENQRKNGVFARKTIALTVEKRRKVESGKVRKLKSLVNQRLAGFWTKADKDLQHMEKLWIKNFLMWESVWKMLQNRVKPSFFEPCRRKMTVFDTHI